MSILVLALIVLLDNTLSFSYYYNTEKKIEQVSKLNSILANSTIEEDEKNELIILKREIIDRQTWKDKTWNLISRMEFSSNNLVTENNKESIQEINPQRSYWLHFVSSSWLWLILLIALPFAGFFDKSSSSLQALGILLLIEPLIYGIAWVFAKVFSYIPIIFGSPIYNYILNAVLCFLIFALFSAFKRKKSTSANAPL